MAKPPEPKEFHVPQGGKLMTGMSADSAGAANWIIKRDWRRDLDVEMRAEGYDLFAPNYLTPDQPPTNGAPITLVAMCRRANGQIAIVVGTQTTLWRYVGVADQIWQYEDTGYVNQWYGMQPPGTSWMVIGDNFSTSGHRWEACEVNGYLVLNNGVDLPVTYQVQDPQVYPIYELREQGVVSVGTVWEHDGILMCADIKIFKPTKTLLGTYEGIPSTGGPPTGSWASYGAQIFPLSVGTEVTMNSSGVVAGNAVQETATVVVTSIAPDLLHPPGTTFAFVGFVNPDLSGQGQITFEILSAIMHSTNPYGTYTDDTLIDHYHDRVLWSAPGLPRRFASVIPCTVNAYSNLITLDYPVKSLVSGMSLLILGAGINGGNLQGDIVSVVGTAVVLGNQVVTSNLAEVTQAVNDAQASLDAAIAAEASTANTLALALTAYAGSPTVANSAAVDTARLNEAAALRALDAAKKALAAAKAATTITTTCMAADMFGSIAGIFEDLEGDGSGVLKGLKLRDFSVIYTETSIYLANYTGPGSTPFTFTPIIMPKGTALFHRDTLVGLTGASHSAQIAGGFYSFGGAAHIYAGKNAFYRFDLTNQVPTEIPEFQQCQSIFFAAARQSQVYAADNGITKEIFFCFGFDSGVDKALRWDYRFGSVSTTTVPITAAASILRPTATVVTGQSEEWFVMGTLSGQLLRYGLVASDAVDCRIDGGTVKVSKSNADPTHLIASAAFFNPNMIGWSVITDLSQSVLAIVGYVSPTEVVILGTPLSVAETFSMVNAIWHRAGQAYVSTLRSGAESFGSISMQKVLDRYQVILASNCPGSPLTVNFWKGLNPQNMSLDITKTIPNPQADGNLVPVLSSGYFLQDELVAGGINNPLRLAARIFDPNLRQTRGFDRS